MSPTLLNFSGHALSGEVKKDLLSRYKAIEDIFDFDINFSRDIDSQFKEILAKVECPLDGSVSVTIIPPGQSTLSILLIIFLHGLLGYFPAVCYLKSEASGQYLASNVFHFDGLEL